MLAGQRKLNVGKSDLRGRMFVVKVGNARKGRTNTTDGLVIARAALLQKRFSFFLQKFQVENGLRYRSARAFYDLRLMPASAQRV